MATRGWEVSRCFLTKIYWVRHKQANNYRVMENKDEKETMLNGLLPDLSDVEEARKAFIASEVFNRKY